MKTVKTKFAAAFVASATLATLAAAGFSVSSGAAVHDGHAAMHEPAAAAASAATATPLADGVVQKIDKSAGTVTIAHGPLVNLGMPAMTMAFRVKEAAWLAKMKAGRKIRFAADQADGALTVVRFEPVK